MSQNNIVKRKFRTAIFIGGLVAMLIAPGINVEGSLDSNEKMVTTNEVKPKTSELEENNLHNEFVLAGVDLDNYEIVNTKNNLSGPVYHTVRYYKDSLKEQKKFLKKQKEIRKRSELVKYYSKVYNMKPNKILKIFIDQSYVFSEESLKDTDHPKEIELKILKEVQETKEAIGRSNVTYLLKNTYKKEKTIREMIMHYSNLFDYDPYLAMSIQAWESGWFKESIAIKKNNPGAIKNQYTGEYIEFENIEQGIIADIDLLKRKYEGMSLEKMQSIYASGSKTWAENVNKFYKSLKKNPYSHSIYDDKK